MLQFFILGGYMQRFRYTKYQEQKEYDDYFSLFEKDKEVQRYVSFWKEKSYFIFMDNQFIGIFSLFPFYPQRMEIRRWILPELRNQGLGTEIAKDITDFAFPLFLNVTKLFQIFIMKTKILRRVYKKLAIF